MNFNLKSVAFVLFALFTVNTVYAQRGKSNLSAEQQAEKQTERMTKELSLTDVQVKQVAALNLKYAQKKESLRSTSNEETNNKTVMKQLRSEQETEFKGILTTEQMIKLETMHPKRGGGKGKKMSNKGENGKKSSVERAEMQTERLTEHLSLTDTQAAKIRAIIWKSDQKMQQVKANETSEKVDFKTMHEKRDAEIKAVLNAEQLDKFESRKKNGRKGDRNS